MFDKMKGMGEQFQMLQKLMKDENFRAFVSHPKVQALFSDPDFKNVAKEKDFNKILAHPKFAALMRDPELAALMAKLNPKDILGRP